MKVGPGLIENFRKYALPRLETMKVSNVYLEDGLPGKWNTFSFVVYFDVGEQNGGLSIHLRDEHMGNVYDLMSFKIQVGANTHMVIAEQENNYEENPSEWWDTFFNYYNSVIQQKIAYNQNEMKGGMQDHSREYGLHEPAPETWMDGMRQVLRETNFLKRLLTK
jgi:hypothetical protein